jgi:hypothetical protein
MLHKDYDRNRSVEKIAGHEPRGACRQDELIGGRPPVVLLCALTSNALFTNNLFPRECIYRAVA